MRKQIPPFITQLCCGSPSPPKKNHSTIFLCKDSGCPSWAFCFHWAHADTLEWAALVVVVELLLLCLVLLWIVGPGSPDVAPPGSPQVPLPHAL